MIVNFIVKRDNDDPWGEDAIYRFTYFVFILKLFPFYYFFCYM